jgi:hypothetical protein
MERAFADTKVRQSPISGVRQQFQESLDFCLVAGHTPHGHALGDIRTAPQAEVAAIETDEGTQKAPFARCQVLQRLRNITVHEWVLKKRKSK